jgi:hypothetical protein
MGTPAETERQLTAAECEYVTAAGAEREEARSQFEEARARYVHADAALTSFVQHLFRKYAIDPRREGFNAETGLISPLEDLGSGLRDGEPFAVNRNERSQANGSPTAGTVLGKPLPSSAVEQG